MNPFEKTSTTEVSGLARSIIVSPDPLTTKHIVFFAICSSITSITLFIFNSLYKHIVLAFMYIFLVKRTSVTDATQMVILKSKKRAILVMPLGDINNCFLLQNVKILIPFFQHKAGYLNILLQLMHDF